METNEIQSQGMISPILAFFVHSYPLINEEKYNIINYIKDERKIKSNYEKKDELYNTIIDKASTSKITNNFINNSLKYEEEIKTERSLTTPLISFDKKEEEEININCEEDFNDFISLINKENKRELEIKEEEKIILFFENISLINKENKKEEDKYKIKEVTYYIKPNNENSLNKQIIKKIKEKIIIFKEIILTIHNIPSYITINITYNDINNKYFYIKKSLIIKNNKLFVYDNILTIFYGTNEFLWDKLEISFKESDEIFLKNNFYNILQSNRLMFPIYNINKIIKKIEPEKYILEDKYIKISNFWEKLYKNSLLSINNKERKYKSINIINDKSMEILRDIIYKIKSKLILLFHPPINNLSLKDNIKNIFIECCYLLNYSGIVLNINEDLSIDDIEVISLYSFLYKKITKTGFNNLYKYDKLIGNKWRFNDIFIYNESQFIF